MALGGCADFCVNFLLFLEDTNETPRLLVWRRLSWLFVLPHLIITLSQKALVDRYFKPHVPQQVLFHITHALPKRLYHVTDWPGRRKTIRLEPLQPSAIQELTTPIDRLELHSENGPD
jgi:hypothetical protein